MKVIELQPSGGNSPGGWYTEILAPYLKKNGLLIAAHFNPKESEWRAKMRKNYEKRIENNEDFNKVLLIDDLSDTGLTLNKSIEWLRKYGPTKDFIKEVKTACLWKKKSSTFEPDFCPIRLDSDPWIVQPTEHYEELSIKDVIEKNK